MMKLALILLVLATGHARADTDATITVGAQGTAAAVVLTGGTVMLLKTYGACGFLPGELDSRWCLHPLAGFGIPTLAVAGAIASVQLIGDARGGTGSLLGTTLGLGAGFVVGLGTTYVVYKLARTDSGPLAATILITAMAVGSVVGYHLTSDAPAGTMRVPLIQRWW